MLFKMEASDWIGKKQEGSSPAVHYRTLVSITSGASPAEEILHSTGISDIRDISSE
eukprot:COSAG02_NODE_2576_length_8498_cov_4.245386_1_plen_56_part_00